jgi:transposase
MGCESIRIDGINQIHSKTTSKKTTSKAAIDQSGKNVQVVWLPPRHSELQPVETLFAIVKIRATKQTDTKNE